MSTSPEGLKQCYSNSEHIISCKQWLPYNKFSKCKTGRLGLHNQCKKCRSKYRKSKKYSRTTDKTKVCNGELCLMINENGVEKDISCFNSDSSNTDGLQTYCKSCRQEMSVKSRSKLDNFLNGLFKDLQSNVSKKSRALKIEITVGDLLELFHKQNEKCALSGLKMTHLKKIRTNEKKHIMSPYNISVDRIDSSKGYTKTNIQLVCAIFNRMKYQLTNSEFIDICKKVTNHCNKNGIMKNKNFKLTKTIKQYITYKFCTTKCNNDRRSKKLKFHISKDDIFQLNDMQKGCCALTGIKMTYLKNNGKGPGKCNFHNISIDRIDSNKGYSKDNIQLVCAIINIIKSDLSDERFISLCKTIVEHNNI